MPLESICIEGTGLRLHFSQTDQGNNFQFAVGWKIL